MRTKVLRTVFRTVGVAGALWLVAAAASAQANEPFQYPVGSFPGNGGTGWAGPWTASSTPIISPGLTHPNLPSSGNALGKTPGSAAVRMLAKPIAGAKCTTLVLRALIRSDVDGTPATQATLGNYKGVGVIPPDTFIIGDLPQPDPNAGNWGLQNTAGRFYSNIPVAANATTLLVAQIDFDVSGPNDRMRLWVNPPMPAFTSATPAVDVTNADVTTFTGVFWQVQQNQAVDEIEVSATQTGCGQPGQLKVCKVAGTGVAVGTSFTFTAGSAPPFTVPAGPGPGGTCRLGPTFPVGTTVTVAETVPSGVQVSSIAVAPPSQLVGTPSLAGGSVDVTIGSGVTEVTFTDTRTGFLEICKRMDPSVPGAGSFTFYVNPGNLGPFQVPAGSCSPAIEVAAGPVTIKEILPPGTSLAGCQTIPAAMQGNCNIVGGTSTVNVVPGDVSTQTIAFLTNRSLWIDDRDHGVDVLPRE